MNYQNISPDSNDNTSIGTDFWNASSVTPTNAIRNIIDENNLNETQLAEILCCPINIAKGIIYSNVYYSTKAIAKIYKLFYNYGLIKHISTNISSPPALFNYSQTSGFVYKVVGCDIQGMHWLNYKEDFLSIISSIKQNYALEYVGCRNEVFEQNIRLVDSRMDEILQEALLMNAGYFDSPDSTSITDICTSLAIQNPVHVRNPQVFYEAKLKAFLFASFAGMTASTDWNGRKKLTGGYIDVDREGELLYYRAISDDIFENYLFKHTYIDRPDRGVNKALAVAESKVYIEEGRKLTETERKRIIYRNGENGAKNSKKGDFGYVYQDGDDFYIVINFQIRFR